MSYPAVTPARLKALKPQFVSQFDDVVQGYLDMAGRVVDASWSGGDYEAAVAAFACHLMTLDGMGSDETSQQFKRGVSDYETIKSADLTLTRFQRRAEATPYVEWLQSTPCGKFYHFLLGMNRGGPRVLMASAHAGASAYAKDQPSGSYGWPGVFG